MDDLQKEFLTIGETRAALGSSRSFIYKLIANHSLTPFKVGRRSYIRAEQIKTLFKPRQ